MSENDRRIDYVEFAGRFYAQCAPPGLLPVGSLLVLRLVGALLVRFAKSSDPWSERAPKDFLKPYVEAVRRALRLEPFF
ncbi:MAG: hypothetical protein WEE03_05920 [Chloroflexota bacterium]